MNQEAGLVICILDALDECEESDRNVLIQEIGAFYRIENETRLKFLITSRGYSDIRSNFGYAVTTYNLRYINLKGEEESEAISKEINLVIDVEVRRIARGREPPIHEKLQDRLIGRLKKEKNRTYLWLHLILNEIKTPLKTSTGELDKLITTMPSTVPGAYERILDRIPGRSRRKAKWLLHIVVSAGRPLNLIETNIAFAIL